MSFDYDATNVKPFTGGHLVPPGKYTLEVAETETKRTKDGHLMIMVNYKIIGGLEDGHKIKFHNVVFLPPDAKGAGIAIHYLKTIGEPCEGKLRIEPQNWLGKRLIATIEHRQYNGKTLQNVKFVDPVPAEDSEEPAWMHPSQ